jgi:hypothetical protein
MQIQVYEVVDHDVLNAYFGEDSADRRILGLGTGHGELIFAGNMTETPGEGDILEVGGEEYLVIVKIYHTAENLVELVVHHRHIEAPQSS